MPHSDQRQQETIASSLLDPDGVVRVRDLNMAPSDLWSDEFRKFYVDNAAAKSDPEFLRPFPARTAPKAEWDAYDRWRDERHNTPLVKAAQQRYATNVERTSIAGVDASIVTPKEGVAAVNRRRVLINLHCGGFVINRGLCVGEVESIPVAAIGKATVITLDYRQAPMHRYPAASEDVEAVYLRLLNQYEPDSVGIYGSSAGGVLASQIVARLNDKGLPRPAAVGIFAIAPPPPYPVEAPWGRGWGDSGVWFWGAPKNRPADENEAAAWDAQRWYMEGADINDPIAYPGSSDEVLARFPPTLLLSGTRDWAVSTVIATNARLLRLGVDSSLYLMEGAPHVAHVTAVDTPEAHDAHAYVWNWFDKHLAR